MTFTKDGDNIIVQANGGLTVVGHFEVCDEQYVFVPRDGITLASYELHALAWKCGALNIGRP